MARLYVQRADWLINAADRIGNTPLHKAVEANDEAILLALIESKSADLNAVNKYGNTALHYACLKGNLSLAKMLIVEGADVTIKNKSDESCLKTFLRNFDFGSVSDVLEFVPKAVWTDYLKSNDNGYTLLWHACKNGQLDDVESLLRAYPKMSDIPAPDGTSPHFVAFIRGHRHIIAWMKNQLRLELTYEETKLGQTDSPMCLSTIKIPMFNEDIEAERASRNVHKSILLAKLDQYILGDLCPLRLTSFESETTTLFLRDIDVAECLTECEK